MSWVDLLTGLLIGCSLAANQEPASLLTRLLTMTTTHKFPSLVHVEDLVEDGVVGLEAFGGPV